MIILFALYNLFYNIDRIKGEIYLSSLSSPDNKYILEAYLIDGGPISGDEILIELMDNETKKRRNIYYNYPESAAEMKWIDNDTLSINGITLEIDETYDFRKE